jgi:hypothetical protein
MSRPKLVWRAGGMENKAKFLKGMIALQAKAQKFWGAFLQKGDDGSLRTVEAKTICAAF